LAEIGTVERAFELARSGKYLSVDEVRRQLRTEGSTDVQAHLGGSSIVKQLRQAIALAKSRTAGP
jgi:hypothetical protein